MNEPLYFDELQVGDRWQSQGRTVTETDVVNFAGFTGDFDPLHTDHEFASQSPFRKPVAHGLLGLSWVAGLGSHSPSVRTLAFLGIERWEFLKPLFVGDTVRVVTEVVAKSDRGRRSGRVTWKRQLINQGGTVVQSGTFFTLVSTDTLSNKIRRDPAHNAIHSLAPHAPSEKLVS